ncbi:MAG: NADH-quinone oxidoreductase subunit A [Myxococcota bacterium]|nr:NADH-quinone oxidoreductase subunit A [Myxococcota bacterium]
MAEYVGVLIMLGLVAVPGCLGWMLITRRRREPGEGSPEEPADVSPPRPDSSPGAGSGFFLAAAAFVVLQAAGLVVVAWALAFGQLAAQGLVEVGIFLLPLAVAVAYLWRRGALDW